MEPQSPPRAVSQQQTNLDTASPRTKQRVRKQKRATMERQLLQEMIQRKIQAENTAAEALASPMQRDRANSFSKAVGEDPVLAQETAAQWGWWSAASAAAAVIPYVYRAAVGTPARSARTDIAGEIDSCKLRLSELQERLATEGDDDDLCLACGPTGTLIECRVPRGTGSLAAAFIHSWGQQHTARLWAEFSNDADANLCIGRQQLLQMLGAVHMELQPAAQLGAIQQLVDRHPAGLDFAGFAKLFQLEEPLGGVESASGRQCNLKLAEESCADVDPRHQDELQCWFDWLASAADSSAVLSQGGLRLAVLMGTGAQLAVEVDALLEWAQVAAEQLDWMAYARLKCKLRSVLATAAPKGFVLSPGLRELCLREMRSMEHEWRSFGEQLEGADRDLRSEVAWVFGGEGSGAQIGCQAFARRAVALKYTVVEVESPDQEQCPPEEPMATEDPVLAAMVHNTNQVLREAAMPGTSNGWVLEKEKGGVALYTREQSSTNTPAVKVVAEFDVPAEFVYLQLINPELTFDSSSSRKAPETVAYYPPDSVDTEAAFSSAEVAVNLIQVVHSYLKLPIVSDRDFVCAEFYGSINSNFVYTGASVEHPLCPPTRKYVRGEISMGGWVIQPAGNNCSKVTFINVADPAASLPKMVARMGVDSSAKSVVFFRKLCRQEFAKAPAANTASPDAQEQEEGLPAPIEV